MTRTATVMAVPVMVTGARRGPACWSRRSSGHRGQRVGQRERARVQRLADDRALDAERAQAAIARRSARLDTPPLAMTGRSVRAQTRRSRSRFGPRSMPSLSHVGDHVPAAAVGVEPGEASSTARRRRWSSRARPAWCRARPARPRSGRRARRWRARTQSGFSSAAVPMTTRAQPVASAAVSDGVVADPAGQLDRTSSRPISAASCGALEPRPKAASRSTRWIHSAPASCQASAASSGSP